MDAGPYRVELVPAGTVVTVHITLDDDSAVDTAAMTGTAILLIVGKPVRVALVPAAPGTLSADTGVAVPSDVKGAVQILGADGVTVQAKFQAACQTPTAALKRTPQWARVRPWSKQQHASERRNRCGQKDRHLRRDRAAARG